MTPQEVVQGFDNLALNSPEELEGLEIRILKTLQGDITRRVFNEGEDSFGKSMGGYSKSWAIARKEIGRQTRYKDLQFKGDLKKSIEVGKSEGINVIGYLTDEQRLKVEYNEAYLNTKIFDFNQEESAKVGFELQIGIEEIIVKYL